MKTSTAHSLTRPAAETLQMAREGSADMARQILAAAPCLVGSTFWFPSHGHLSFTLSPGQSDEAAAACQLISIAGAVLTGGDDFDDALWMDVWGTRTSAQQELVAELITAGEHRSGAQS